MDFISTKNMTNDTAPKRAVLVKYLEPSWGGWSLRYGMAYFDNPNDYENPEDGEGWNDNTGNSLNVVAYLELPELDEEENPFRDIDQKQTKEKYGTYTPNLGCVSGLF